MCVCVCARAQEITFNYGPSVFECLGDICSESSQSSTEGSYSLSSSAGASFPLTGNGDRTCRKLWQEMEMRVSQLGGVDEDMNLSFSHAYSKSSSGVGTSQTSIV